MTDQLTTMFKLDSGKANGFAVLQDLGPIVRPVVTMGGASIQVTHEYAVVAIFMDEDDADSWVKYHSEGHKMVVCPIGGLSGTVFIDNVYGNASDAPLDP